MYDLARKGAVTEEEMVARKVTVHELRVSDLDPATGTFALHVCCGGGTYVRTLIVDLARAVGSAAHEPLTAALAPALAPALSQALALALVLALSLILTTEPEPEPDTTPDPNPIQVGSGAHMSALERTHNGPFHVCVDGAPPLSEARKVRPVVCAAC